MLFRSMTTGIVTLDINRDDLCVLTEALEGQILAEKGRIKEAVTDNDDYWDWDDLDYLVGQLNAAKRMLFIVNEAQKAATKDALSKIVEGD